MHCPLGACRRRGFGLFCRACHTTDCIFCAQPFGGLSLRRGLWTFCCVVYLSFGLLFFGISFLAGALGLPAFLFSQELQELMTLPMALFVGSACVLHCIASVRITALRCFLACFVLLVMSANSAASWRTTMVQAGVQESIADAIIRLGYDEEGLFRAAFVDQQAFEGWLNKLRHKIGDAALAALSDEDWSTHPHAARLRMLWKSGMPAQPPSTQATPDALALVPAGSLPGAGTKLTAAGREQMRRKLEKDYSSCVVTRETLPALCFLQSIHQQAADKFFEWLPWRRILSEEQLLEVKARRSRSTSDGPAPDEWDMELAGAALRVQQTLETRAHAFAMVSACHLHSWVVYTKKFMALYARKPSEMFRAPTVQEAEARLSLKRCFSCASLDTPSMMP